MFKSQKNVFWEALLVTIFIFGIGILAGILLENSRTSQINSLFQQSEIDLLDIKLQNEIYSDKEYNCDVAIEENLKFANRVYEEAKKLERYEKASTLTEEIILQHKKYDLLRIMILLNSNKIREKCEDSYSEIAYFYYFETEELTIRAKQNVFSKSLSELKEKYGCDILLIPIGISDKISSINLVLSKYDISRGDLPMILINGETKITELESIRDLEQYLD